MHLRRALAAAAVAVFATVALFGADAPKKPAVDAKLTQARWQKILPGQVAEAEVRQIRDRLAENLKSVGKYNGSYKEIRTDGAVLAALGHIMQEGPQKVTWKENARHVRDLGKQIEARSGELGKKSYEGAKSSFDTLSQVLDGKAPEDFAKAPSKSTVPESVARVELMKRMQRAVASTGNAAATEEDFRKSTSTLAHELAMLAAMARTASDPGYPSADEAEYQAHLKGLLEGVDAAQTAIEKQNFRSFTDSRTRIRKACNECHVEYRFGE